MKKFFVVLVSVLVLFSGVGMADIIFEVTGTANAAKWGYTLGDSYTFTFRLNPSFANNSYCLFNAAPFAENSWNDEETGNTPTFTDVSGDGLTGAWTRPTSGQFDPFSFVEVTDPGAQRLNFLYAGNDFPYSIGLQAGGNDLRTVSADSMNLGSIFSFPGSYTDPTVYFTSLTGSYSGPGGLGTGGTIQLESLLDGNLTFTATTVSISVIPEPASVFMMGLGGLLLVGYRRRSGILA